ncbi:hypothetical protein ABB37_06974 [Leptomonas pyrrhocoris]|uniref:Uncharacterized protein n=1 Tax=Leptomonas pyrrhocoris TaxID=157538 RepID=A0A0M9FWN1_LEPPY|nr:hypothetical protein ABB37_06974 [Leptomonas pyrrhocoris]KPA77610.1 hypothetical protein ABB37_06974 [Leptomonas pyrrhocoris]|eukprot:XP_015656049.1 hypothetical protein ABB37_06974 [Leptomonas pyrrhocoris]
MAAPTPAISSAQTGHPISRIATLPSSSANTILLVCAGGSSVSVQPAPQWLTSPVNGGDVHSNSNTAATVSTTGSLQHLRHGTLEPQAAAGVEVGKGADVLLAAAQQWSAHRRDGADTGQQDHYGYALSSSSIPSASPATALTVEQRASLQAGEVTSLCVAALPGTDTSLALVGSTVGTVALFLIEGSHTLCKVAECALVRWSRGGITAQDAVVDVAFSMDPAGRPEFVSAASAGCVVVVDVQLFYRRGTDGDDDGDVEKEEDGVRRRFSSLPSCRTEGDAWSASALRAKAVEALERPNTQLVRRSRSDVFTCAFAGANVVRVLAPQRLHAAVAMDVALVVVLRDGTLRYVERVIDGGSVRLLAEHHRLRFAKGATFIAYAQDSMLAGPSSHSSAQRGGSSAGGADGVGEEADSRALPHVIYRYRLSPHQVNVCQLGNSAAAEWVTLVNDAALYFSEKDAVCHVVVAGTQLVPTSKATGRPSPPNAPGSGAKVSLDVAARAAAGWTLGRVLQEKGSGGSGGGHRALGWWAVAHNVVLPRYTFDRAALERHAFEQQQQLSSHTRATAGPSSSSAAAYSSHAGSPFTVHVQSNVTALPAASLSATSALSMSPGRPVTAAAAAAAAAAGGLDGSAFYESLPTSPVVSSPTGTGAHVAAGNTTAGVGNGFAAAAMVAGVLVLSTGTDVYVGDLNEVPAKATSLPVPRPVRSFGAVVENVSCGPYRDVRSVLVATGSRVVPVSL